ncbi:hypothetical protein LJ737_03150 [Hymenobacter sp. 15J16-1T3B]|uniref:hypothetical protein n=1 Tax=Hymenobacter sp. 15J16-1T3B TaxID=2886941 RepID=UPI001D126FA5|nr:hypothetical protein [Hymenobacter sp. 15J16-1T3B]MCC3156215.1 hypothetical protein [Hymenobacter sp. 15J16-1T3B]
MPFNPYQLASLAALLALATGCRHNDPAPRADYSFSRHFHTLDGVVPAQSERAEHPSNTIQAAAELTEAGLELRFYPPANQEELTLHVPSDKLKPGLVGDYSADEDGAPRTTCKTYYVYRFDAPPFTQERLYTNRVPVSYSPSGTLHITKYDARRKLLSGTYDLSFAFIPDPKGPTSSGLVTWRLDLEGKFDNMVVRP